MAVRFLIGTPVKVTMRRMYGRHYHALCTHAPIINRLRCLRSTNTEQEERSFNTLKSITNQTSNMRPEHIISNGFLRLQAEQQINATYRSLAKQESYISSLASKLEQAPNSFIPLYYIKRYPDYYQAHLERLGNFLILGQGVWWKKCKNGITFYDGPNEPAFRDEGPPLHYFRSQSIKSEKR